MKRKILFAENDSDARKKWGKLLEISGYGVLFATNPSETRSKLVNERIDLAILDVRLDNDKDETDISGLVLAADPSFIHIPKIILTGYRMDYKDQRKVWEAVGGEPPAVVAFVGKDELPKILLEEIERAFNIWPHLSMLSSKVSEQIKADHDAVRSQAKWNYVLSLVLAIFGFVMIISGILLTWVGKLPGGIVGTTSGLILETIGYLFFTRMECSSKRMDVYHLELMQTYGVEFLLSVAERLPETLKAGVTEKLIYGVMKTWYPGYREIEKINLKSNPSESEILVR